MTQINRSAPVMVTGATGYVAGHLVKKLLDAGLTVHAPIHDPENVQKLKYLDAIAENSPGAIQYFKADLRQPHSYAQAMDGCELVYHTASPFKLNIRDSQKELIDPALLGTRDVLKQANQIESVKRIIVTSNCAAIYDDYPWSRKPRPQWLAWLFRPIFNMESITTYLTLKKSLPLPIGASA